MRRLHALLRRIGIAGVCGVGVLLFCVPFYVATLRPAERELAAQRAAALERSRGQSRSAATDSREDELQRFYALFPRDDRVTEEVQRLYRHARRAGLELAQGEYRMERPPAAGLSAYRVSLPVRGSYDQVRAFVGAILTDIPFASVDALRFERKKSGDAQLEGQVRLTMHFRPVEERR